MSADAREKETSGIPNCPRCTSQDIWRSGTNSAGTRQWRCKTCGRVFVVAPYLSTEIRLIADRMIEAGFSIPKVAVVLKGFVSRRWLYNRKEILNG